MSSFAVSEEEEKQPTDRDSIIHDFLNMTVNSLSGDFRPPV
mgnify:CR=1 FL=1